MFKPQERVSELQSERGMSFHKWQILQKIALWLLWTRNLHIEHGFFTHFGIQINKLINYKKKKINIKLTLSVRQVDLTNNEIKYYLPVSTKTIYSIIKC